MTKKRFLFFAMPIAIFFASCSKSDNNSKDDAPAFVGTYNMISNCWTGTYPVTIVANGNNSIILPIVINNGTPCQKQFTIPANVSGNTIIQTTVTLIDACNNYYTETVSGTLNGNNLSLTYVTSNSLGSLTCNYSGPK